MSRDHADVLPHLVRVAASGARSRDAAAVRRRAAAGSLVPLAPGVFVDRGVYRACDPRQRHVLLVAARLPRLDGRVVASHWAAAALHRLPCLSSWPTSLHVVDPGRERTQTTPGVVRHAGRLGPQDVVVRHGLRCTSVLRTVVDLALSAPFADTVAVLDAALHARLVTVEEVERALTARAATGARGVRDAHRALAFAREETESPGESQTRVGLHLLGAPEPELQHEFSTGSGATARVDFWLPRQGVVIEFDGAVKYQDREMLAGRSVTQVVVAEKQREDQVRRANREVEAFVRLVWREVRDLARLRGILVGAGVPCRY